MHKAIGIWVNLCRFALALVFIFSGFVKSVDPLGTCYKIEDYLAAFGWTGIVPAFIPLPASILLAIVEFTLGIYFLFGIRRRISTLLILLIMLFMTPLTLYLAIEDPVSDCGCFGDAVILSNWATFWKNVALLVAALSVFKWGNRIIRLISEKSQWLVSVYTLAFITGIAIYSLHYLPILDFRPYKTGANIREGMEIPAGAKPNVYESVFILEKNGVEKALVNFGNSSVLAVGSHPLGDYWPVGVDNPFTKEHMADLKLRDTSLSVSGNMPTHPRHIVNPLTGKFVEAKKMVSVVAKDPVVAEVLTTAFMVADEERIPIIASRFDIVEKQVYKL